MVALEIAGELEIRSGSGAYVRRAVNPMSLVLDSGPGPFELLRARLLIEGEIASDAALYASAGDLTKIEKTLQSMRRLGALQNQRPGLRPPVSLAIGESGQEQCARQIVMDFGRACSRPVPPFSSAPAWTPYAEA